MNHGCFIKFIFWIHLHNISPPTQYFAVFMKRLWLMVDCVILMQKILSKILGGISIMKNSAIVFLVGLIMLAAGLFWLTSMVQVTSMWGSGLRVGGTTIPSGLTLVPLIAGIVWIFFNPKAVGAKLLCLVGVVIIIASVLMSIRFHVPRVSMFEFVLVFIGIAGGAGLIARVLFAGGHKS